MCKIDFLEEELKFSIFWKKDSKMKILALNLLNLP